ncbi:hypothetical protein E2C01_085518 [Portunus trituberculatus]|uniref:Uncharacterized protein n=1 Tax=Portunus trituberculatus TaxID=210409 RepID=A0A5B7JAQ4_PORTR|nr:hypothetical protein [Portunus trituberculatus]
MKNDNTTLKQNIYENKKKDEALESTRELEEKVKRKGKKEENERKAETYTDVINTVDVPTVQTLVKTTTITTTTTTLS